ncbi:hypothetical protein ACVNF4_02325 [Streptomyces sp. S6]
MRKHLVTLAATCGLTLAVVSPAAVAFATDTDVPIAVSEDGEAVDPGLLEPEQLAAFTDEPEADAVVVPQETGDAELPEEFYDDERPRTLAAAAATKYKKAQFKRGSTLMWTRDTVYFGYNGSKVTSSDGWQENGHVFPNIAKNGGITRYQTDSGTHKWRAKNTIGAGIPTPWGDVKVYSKDYTHYFSGTKSGSWNWKG